MPNPIIELTRAQVEHLLDLLLSGIEVQQRIYDLLAETHSDATDTSAKLATYRQLQAALLVHTKAHSEGGTVLRLRHDGNAAATSSHTHR